MSASRTTLTTEPSSSSSSPSITTPLDSILEAFSSEFKNNSDLLREAIPPEEMWPLFIDHPATSAGWLNKKYHEEGYLKKLVERFHNVMTTSLDPTQPDYPVKLVDFLEKKLHKGILSEGGFRTSVLTYYEINESNTTYDGFLEILDDVEKRGRLIIIINQNTNRYNYIFSKKMNLKPFDHIIRLFDPILVEELQENKLEIKEIYDTCFKIPTEPTYFMPQIMCHPVLFGTDIKQETIDGVLKDAKEYQLSIQAACKANSLEDKLTAIAKFTASCVRYHPFTDGNARAIAIECLQYMLKENGFPFAIINPNFSGGYSYAEWKKEILDGMQRTLDLARNKSYKEPKRILKK